MKRFFNWAKNKIVRLAKWIWHECKDWKTFVLFVGVCFVVGIPVWLGYILSIVFHWAWASAVANAMLIFWNVVPGTPFFVVCLSITLGIKKIWEKGAQKEKAKGISEMSKDLEDFVENADEEKDN